MTLFLGLFLISILITNEIQNTTSMIIPQDIEILDGYKVDESSEYYLPDTYLEAESLRDFQLTKAIRNRRSPSPVYRVLESPGLISHFHQNLNNNLEIFNHLKSIALQKRQKRSENSEVKKEEKQIETAEKDNESKLSNLPIAEKQIMEPGGEYYRKGGWNIQAFNTDYTRSQTIDDDEPTPEATNNEGIKGRTPRVNFVTHPKKAFEQIKERSIVPHKYSPSVIPLSGESRYERMHHAPPYSTYPSDLYPSRSYDPYLRRYDRYDDQYTRYDPYYEDYYLYRKRYDPYDSYSPRIPTYPEPFYEYPDHRYDVPEPRDYRPLYSNDLYYDRPPSSHERNNRRIVYYAHLPEIVRTPPSIDLTYSSYGRDHRYDSYYGNNSPSALPSSGAYQHADKSTTTTKDDYGFIKREKKDHRNYPSYQKSSTPNMKQDP